jgi:hypothetical protein
LANGEPSRSASGPDLPDPEEFEEPDGQSIRIL